MTTVPILSTLTSSGPRASQLEQPRRRRLELSQAVVVDLQRTQTARFRQRSRVGADGLGDENSPNWGQTRVHLEALPVSRQLLDAIDLSSTLDLDSHRLAVTIRTDHVDRAYVGRVFAPDERQAFLHHPRTLGEQLLEMGLHPVLLQPGVLPQVVVAVVQHLVERDHQALALGVGHLPAAL